MSEVGDGAYAPSTPGPTPLFLDTSGLFAYFNPRVDRHESARAFVRAVGAGELPYRPLYTSTYVVDELLTLLVTKGTHEMAASAHEMLTTSEAVALLSERAEWFEAAGERFCRYDDASVSFTDHLAVVQMEAEGIEHVFSYDGDFAALGRTAVPHSSG